jgi:hypothetical protein
MGVNFVPSRDFAECWKLSRKPRVRVALLRTGEMNAGNIIYLADFRNRARPLNEPTDPRRGAAAARPVELSFLSAIARPVFQVCQPQFPTRHAGAIGGPHPRGGRSSMACGAST